MSNRLDKKVIVITGAASGMGRAATLRFLDEGAAVVAADLNVETGNETTKLARDAGHEHIEFVRTDVTQESDIEAMITTALDRFGRLDGVFNNAGIGGVIGPITDISVDDWDETFAMLSRSVFLGIKHAAKVLVQQDEGGVILSTASIAGMAGGAGPQAYSAAKASVINLTKNAAVELAPHRIRVNAIAPGVIVTPLAARGGMENETAATLQPWPEAGLSEDIANLALFLMSDESRFVTGANYLCDGGVLARGPRIFRPEEDGGGRRPGSRIGMTYGSTGLEPKLRPPSHEPH